LGQPAPEDLKAEVQAAIASAVEAGESSKSTMEEVTSTPPAEDQAPTEPQP
jgi:hypothetical protein